MLLRVASTSPPRHIPVPRSRAAGHRLCTVLYREPRRATGGRPTCLRLVTPGFYRQDKGFDTILKAVIVLISRGRDVSYEIIGQPQQQFPRQALYRERIEQMIDDLMLRQRSTVIRDSFRLRSRSSPAVSSGSNASP